MRCTSSTVAAVADLFCRSNSLTLCCAEPSTRSPLGDRAAFARGAFRTQILDAQPTRHDSRRPDRRGAGDALVLYFGAAKNPAHLRDALDYLSSPSYWQHINIEEESYVPLTLFRYGRDDAAYQVLIDISGPQKACREYPEVSYSVIEALVSGVMGLEPAHEGEAFDVLTLSRLPSNHDRATLSTLSIRKNHLDITHTGRSWTRMKNVSGPAVRWRAAFSGKASRLYLDGTAVAVKQSTLAGGAVISWADVTVPSGAVRVVSR